MTPACHDQVFSSVAAPILTLLDFNKNMFYFMNTGVIGTVKKAEHFFGKIFLFLVGSIIFNL